jgi:SPP1 gp7 family putative phage head morphogenesis protein
MPTVFDALVRHQLYLEGLKAGRAQDTDAKLLQLDKAIRAELANLRYDEMGMLTKAQLALFVKQLRVVAWSVLNPYMTELLKWLEAFMAEDRKLLVAMFAQADDEPELAVDLATPDSDKLLAAAMGTIMGANGLLVLAFLKGSTAYGVVQMENLVRQGYANNWTRRELEAAILGTDAARRRDGAFARFARGLHATNNTIIQHVAAQANWNVAKGLFREYEWVSILDGGTTAICRDRDGNLYLYSNGPIPPAHVGCRSSIMPVIDGQRSPNDSFNAWAKRQPASVIRDLFGETIPNKFEAARPLTLSQFAGKRSLILTP